MQVGLIRTAFGLGEWFMADRVFFVASSPDDFMRAVTVPQQMISDLLEISRVPLGVIEQIGASVAEATGFLDEPRLEDLVGQVIQEEKSADAVVSALRNLRPTAVEDTLKAIEDWRKINPRNAERFSDEAFASVQAALPRLIRPSEALDRQRKAKRLRTLTGHQANEVEIVCDVRPVFNRGRTAIEGFVTQTTLKLVYETQTDDAGCIEVVLPPDLLHELLDKAEKAKKKIEVLRESIQIWIPDGLAESTSQNTAGNEL